VNLIGFNSQVNWLLAIEKGPFLPRDVLNWAEEPNVVRAVADCLDAIV
jgi:hypothetical protein